MEQNSIIRIKDEYLDPNEATDKVFILLDDPKDFREEDRLEFRQLCTDLPIPPIERAPIHMIEEVDDVFYCEYEGMLKCTDGKWRFPMGITVGNGEVWYMTFKEAEEIRNLQTMVHGRDISIKKA